MFSIEETPAEVASEVVRPKATKEKGEGGESAPPTGAIAKSVPVAPCNDDNFMCITIGGQSITINTKPSAEAENAAKDADEDSPENSAESSPRLSKDVTPRKEEVSESPQTQAEPVEEVAREESAVMDLLADFSSPPEADSVDSTPTPGLNSDIMDLLGGLEEVVRAPSPVVTCSLLQGGIGNVAVVDCLTRCCHFSRWFVRVHLII